MRFSLGLFVILLPLAATGLELDGLQGLRDTHYHRVESSRADDTYHVFVGLPSDYADTGRQKYPTVYILDGGLLFPLLTGYQRYLLLAGDVPQVILIGISYGTVDWREGNNRGHDYTADTDEREHWGGAGDFQSFLRDELMPMIEAEYRSRPDRRIVFGQSLGGQFVLYSAQTRPDLFWGHIASNPALHRNLPFYLEQHGNGESRSHLFVSSGANDERRFRVPAVKWIEHWTGMDQTPWELRAVTLDGHNHFSPPPEAYRRGMMWLFR